MKRRLLRLLPVAVAVAGVLAVVLVMQARPGAPAGAVPAAAGSGEEAAVRAAVGDALLTHQQLQRTPVADPAAAPTAPTAEAFAAQRARGAAAILATFSGAAARAETAGLDGAINEETRSSDRFRVVDSGVDAVKITSLSSDATTATAEGTAETWSRMQFKNPDGTWVHPEPHNTIHFTMGLVRAAGGRWTVETFAWDFPPGGGP